MSTTQAIAPQKQIADLRQMLDGMKNQIAAALPKHLTPERMMRVVMTAIQRTPKLMQCSKGSIMGSVIIASQLGLEPDGILGRAYLIPRYNGKTKQLECTFMPGYLGLIDLAQRSGKVSWVASELVYSWDKFEIRYGQERSLVHIPDIDNPERGVFEKKDLRGLKGAYSVVRYKDGETDFEYMPISKLHMLREFSQSKDSDFSPWNTALGIEDMYRKCPIRKLAKRCPLSPEFQKAAQLEELAEVGLPQDLSFEIDPASEAARLATEDKTRTIVNKYSPADSQETGESVSIEFLGRPMVIDPETQPDPQQTPAEQTSAQPQASGKEHESQPSAKSGGSQRKSRETVQGVPLSFKD